MTVSIDRVTVVETVTYTTADIPPITVDTRFSANVPDSVDPILKTPTITGWQKLNMYWIKNVRQLVVKNLTGEEVETRLTKQELKDQEIFSSLQLLILPTSLEPSSDTNAQLIVRPGESCRFEPYADMQIWIRSTGWPVKTVLFVIPDVE